jgi:WD40 repeat protein
LNPACSISATGRSLESYRRDPIGYAKEVLKVELTPMQAHIAEALLVPPHRVLVRSANNVGKSFLSAVLVNWFYDCFNPGICITTAPEARTVKDTCWKEVRVLRNRRVLQGVSPGIRGVEFSPDGRLLVSSGFSTTLGIWDAGTGRALGRVPHSGCRRVLWGTSPSRLLTFCPDRLLSWPVQSPDAQGERALRIGPPGVLPAPSGPGMVYGRMCWCGPGNRWLAVILGPPGVESAGSALRVFRFGPGLQEVWCRQMSHVSWLEGSPNGRWVATGTYDGGKTVCVWDASSGRLEKEWDIGDAEPAFSPDGRWLAAATSRFAPGRAECWTWRVGSWEPGPRIPLARISSSPSPLVFSPDSKLLAVACTMNEVKLLRTDTFQQVAVLAAPEPQLILRLSFSPDGTRLAVAAGDLVQMWDLRAVRERLQELGLDWELAPYPEAPTRPKGLLRVEIAKEP